MKTALLVLGHLHFIQTRMTEADDAVSTNSNSPSCNVCDMVLNSLVQGMQYFGSPKLPRSTTCGCKAEQSAVWWLVLDSMHMKYCTVPHADTQSVLVC